MNVFRYAYQCVYARIWSLLPDKCEVAGCCRQGVRGNENIIGGRIVCDYCHAEMMEKEAR